MCTPPMKELWLGYYFVQRDVTNPNFFQWLRLWLFVCEQIMDKSSLNTFSLFFFFFFLNIPSDEDTGIKDLVQSWLSRQSEDSQHRLAPWIENHFYNALEWVIGSGDFVVETSRVGVVMNGLSHLRGAECSSDFAIKLIRGLGANLSENTRMNFAKDVSEC